MESRDGGGVTIDALESFDERHKNILHKSFEMNYAQKKQNETV